MKKKIIVIVIVLALFLVALFTIYRIGTRTNLGKKIVINGVTFKNAKVYKKDNIYYLDVNITTNEKTTISNIDIIVYDKKGDLIDSLNTPVGVVNKKRKVTAKTNVNISKAYSLNYVINRE